MAAKHIMSYDVHISRGMACTLGGGNYDVLPATVEICVKFDSSHEAEIFERKVRMMLDGQRPCT